MKSTEPKNPNPLRSLVTLAAICFAIVLVFLIGWRFSEPGQELMIIPTDGAADDAPMPR
ncbi:hypothetical protein [Chelativorans sp.]|uniref:hypothetical protein n=1 Tax=Chelativorans sp. TaxID=2203393 RepID=UPI0028124F56|nr:hypothetical protein [Chelativorans sp.]